MNIKRMSILLLALLSAMLFLGCGNQYRDLADLKEKTKPMVLAQLGEPTEKSNTVFKAEGYGAHRSLEGILPAGHPYEVWTYRDKGDYHSIFFADPSNENSDPQEWVVIYTSTLEKGTIY